MCMMTVACPRVLWSARRVFDCGFFFFSSRRRHTRFDCDWSSDVCSSDLPVGGAPWREASTVRLGSFYIDSTEVTVGAYRRYLDSTLGMPPWTGRPPERWPATGVFWVEAVAYCAWRQPGGRLPTEDEWEAAARGPEGLRYPWGDKWVRGFANADSQRDGFAPAGADSLGRSWVGAVDLIGNAWEWTATEAPGPKGELGHIIKGGAFDSPPQNAVAAFRAAFPDRQIGRAHV